MSPAALPASDKDGLINYRSFLQCPSINLHSRLNNNSLKAFEARRNRTVYQQTHCSLALNWVNLLSLLAGPMGPSLHIKWLLRGHGQPGAGPSPCLTLKPPKPGDSIEGRRIKAAQQAESEECEELHTGGCASKRSVSGRTTPAQQKDVCCSNPLGLGECPSNPSHDPEKTLQSS